MNYTRPTLPEPLVLKFIDEIQARKGKTQAIKAPALCRLLDVQYQDSGRGKNGAGRLLRWLGLEALRRGVCVIGDDNGYYLGCEASEVEHAVSVLNAKADALRDRAAYILQSFSHAAR